MPDLTKEYLDEILERFKFLLCGENDAKLAILDIDNGDHIIIEMWETDDGKINMFPIAKLLTEEETAKLKLEGVEPRVPNNRTEEDIIIDFEKLKAETKEMADAIRKKTMIK